MAAECIKMLLAYHTSGKDVLQYKGRELTPEGTIKKIKQKHES